MSIALLTCTVISVATTWFFVVRADRRRAVEAGDGEGSLENGRGGSEASDVDGTENISAVVKEKGGGLAEGS